MAFVSQIEDAEHFFARGRARVQLRARGVERLVEAALAFGFVVVAVAMALLLPSSRALDVPTLAILIAAYVVCSRAKFDIADGHTVPTELVLVPMLFLLPTPAVPLAVAGADLLGRGYDYASGHTSVHRAFHALGDCWHAVGPALLLVAVGAQVFSWDEWPVYLVALLAQLAFDFVPAAIRERFIDGVSVRTLSGLVAPVYALDGALAPIGLLVAFAATQVGAALALLVLPLATVLAVLSRERQARVDQAIELSSAYRGTAMLLGDVVEADDAYTGSHSRGVVELSLAVSDQLGLDHRQRRNVEFAALLHDVGKIAVPKEIINKAGPLDPEEWQVMYRHTIEGEEMLNRVGGVLSEVGRIVRSSHEHYDGSGYPDGLAGEEIPIEARIVACCDAFSAMTTTRSYRKAMPVEAALAEVRACAGTQFDPRVAESLAVVSSA
ncbi:MAG TPA: HD-GYP domain-containing protein [Solirubrobacterales bacterium]|jgi:HD-GYP domain-containing protein (c-di-GMP phosphodiesterase class II)|nr:HD-GYP domain-containing protein [Solirubrobacterales bacterium]